MSNHRNGGHNHKSSGNPITEKRTDSIGINGLVDPSDSVVHKKERSVHSPIGEEAVRGSPPTPLSLPPTAIGSPSSTRFRHPNSSSGSGSPPASIWSDLPNPIVLPALPGPASRAQQLQPGARLSPPVIDGFNRASPPWEGRAMAAPPSKAVAPPALKPSPPRTWSETAKPHGAGPNTPASVVPPLAKSRGASGRATQPSKLAVEPSPTAPNIWEPTPPPQRRGSISSQEPIARPVPPLPTSNILAFMQHHPEPPMVPAAAAHTGASSHMHTLLGPGKHDEFQKSLIPRSVPLSQTQTTSKPPAPLRLPMPPDPDRDAYESGDSASITSDISPQISPFTSPRAVEDAELAGIFEMDDRDHGDHVDSIPSGEHPYGEFPSPTLFVRNINSNVEDDELRGLFEPFGPIRSMYTQCKHRGFVMISYFEIRHAQGAMQALQGRLVRRRKLDIHYSIPKSYGSAHSSPSPSSRSPSTFHRSSSMQRTPSGPWSSTSAINPAALHTSASAPLGGFAMNISAFSPPPPQPALQQPSAVSRLPISASEPLGPRPDAASAAQNASQRPSSPESLITSPADSPKIPSSASVSAAKAAGGRHHRPVGSEDKSKYDMDLDRIRTGDDTRLTLMIKNIPNKYNQKMLLAAVDERHKGTYDFFYLPIDFKNKCNVGYAFVNFVRPISIVAFYQEFNNRKWEKFNSEKVCTISYARIQGKSALIQHFQNSSLMSEDKKCRPIIFHSEGPNQGEQEPFPVGPNIRTRRTVGSKTSKSSTAGRKSGKDEKPSPDPVQSPSSL